MLQFANVFIVYIIEWLLLVCSEQFLFQGGRRFEIALILSNFALWFEKTHATNQSDAKLKPITTWSPAFSRALVTRVVFYFEFSPRASSRHFSFFSFAVVITLFWYILRLDQLYTPNLMVAWVWPLCFLSFFFSKIYFIIVVYSYIEALRQDPSGASAGFSPPLTGGNQTQRVITFSLL